MSDMSEAMVQRAVDQFRKKTNGQVVLVLQGGGALGAYQVGVYQAPHEAGVEPDWIIDTSIGAINASIVAGNKPQDRLGREFPTRGRTGRPSLPVFRGFSSPMCRHSGALTFRWGWIALVSIRPCRSAKHSPSR
jgi:predicted acylesterase/phospholipase RssA